MHQSNLHAEHTMSYGIFTGLIREALRRSEVAGRAAAAAIAALLAELWFPAAPRAISAGGRGLRPEAVGDLQTVADDLEMRAQHAAAFVALFLEPL
jgi:hypothetical protein